MTRGTQQNRHGVNEANKQANKQMIKQSHKASFPKSWRQFNWGVDLDLTDSHDTNASARESTRFDAVELHVLRVFRPAQEPACVLHTSGR